MTKDEAEKTEKKGIKATLKEFAQKYDDQQHAMQCANARAEFMGRWAKLSGLPPNEFGEWLNEDYSADQIDMTNEYILLEWHMCDPEIMLLLGNAGTRDKGLARLPEQCRETYFKVGPSNDRAYCDVTIDMSRAGIRKAKQEARMRKKEEKRAQKERREARRKAESGKKD